MEIPPSGEQIEIRAADVRATVVGVGGGLRSLMAGDLALLDGFPPDEMCHDGRGQILMPWPNRLAGGRYTFQGVPEQVPINEVGTQNAIHGLVRWVPWAVAERRADAATVTHRLFPQPGYPFTLDLTARYTVTGDGLTVAVRAENRGAEPAPFGAGQHPYIRCGTARVNDAWLHVPAATMYSYNAALIPEARRSVAGTDLDFRTERPIGETAINMDYTDLTRDADGLAQVGLRNPDGVTVTVWMDAAFRHVTIYTGETVQPPSRRRAGLAVEPMTCPPNAFASGEDLLVLAPGECWEGNWGVSVRR